MVQLYPQSLWTAVKFYIVYLCIQTQERNVTNQIDTMKKRHKWHSQDHHPVLKLDNNQPCKASASLNGCNSSTASLGRLASQWGGECVSLGDDLSAELPLNWLGRTRDGGGALPHRKARRSSLRICLLLFLAQATMSRVRLWYPLWTPRSVLCRCNSKLSAKVKWWKWK